MPIPLAERLRPTRIEQLAGQEHLTGEGSILRTAIENGQVPSMILWGPPGTGKTTIAHIISNSLLAPFYALSAVSSGVKDVREVIDRASGQQRSILFIDEIHRFNKSQQDALLNAVEKGVITLIGATTENPSFEVNSALLSRCQVYVLKGLEKKHLEQLLHDAIEKDRQMHALNITLHETEALLSISGGDARKLLNLLELVAETLAARHEPVVITNETVMDIAQQRVALYDKQGEQHYDIISAFIKSMRGSDPNAAVYWLARMLAGGEDMKFIARRMVICNANPTALVLANAAFEAVHKIGYPEGRIVLSQCAVYLATSPKSNGSYMAIEDAMAAVQQYGDLPVPLHIRNAPTKLMKDLDYGKNYQYAHSFEQNFINQEYLPDELSGRKFYEPGRNAREEEARKFLQQRWKDKYGY
jgi:putative ATPase